MLKKLYELKIEAERLVDENISKELIFTPTSRALITSAYNEHFPGYPAKLSDSVLRIENRDHQSAYLPFQWFARIHHCRELIEALNDYVPYVDKLKRDLNDDELIRDLPKVDWKTRLKPDQITKIENFINDQFSTDEEKELFREFLDGRSWLNLKTLPETLVGKKLNRQPSDYISSAITTITKLINDTAGKLDQFIELYMNSSDVRDLISSLSFSDISAPKAALKNGENIIYYGAPGTGKSYTIDEEIDEEHSVRTVFHEDTQNSDFLGCLKPAMDGKEIKYEFRPGPFTRSVIKAANAPDEHHWLVIEEINRAPAAAVFGEIFQLLDRESGTGESRYGITLSDQDMLAYINDQASAVIKDGKLKIPGNLSLLATMNSSDQAVMPLDTAFKRRWKFRYIPLDFVVSYNNTGKPCAKGKLLITDQSGKAVEISWKDFATAVNIILTSNGIPEDRHLGPYFLSDSELTGEGRKEALIGKLFMYLWDDVLRHGMTGLLFCSEIKTYGQLAHRYKNSEPVFSDTFYEKVVDQLVPVQANTSVQETAGDFLKVAEEKPDYAATEN